MKPIKLLSILVLLSGFLFVNSCKHEPFMEEIINPGGNPVDTTVTNPPDTTVNNPPDTTGLDLCDPDTVYFVNDVLPILNSSCAKSGCHNEASAQDDVILSSYAFVMSTGDIDPGDAEDSEIYEVLVENDPDKIMPPPPAAPLSNEQISIIRDWINQGALNNECDENAGGCNTSNVSFNLFIAPLIANQCQGCHAGTNPSGGIALTNYNEIKAEALNGLLWEAMSHESGVEKMPQGGNRLPQCDIDKVAAWIQDGALNN